MIYSLPNKQLPLLISQLRRIHHPRLHHPIALPPCPGDTSLLRFIPIGTQIHKSYPGSGGQLVRSVGTSALLLKKELEKNLAMVLQL